MTLAQRAKRQGFYAAARYAYRRGIPFSMCYISIFGRLPRK